jgi:hypothetical protein
MPSRATIERTLPWLLRAGWVAVLVVGGRALDSALDGRTALSTDVVRWSAAAMWVIGVAAMAIPAVVSLTATRLVVPLAIPTALLAWSAGAGSGDALGFTVLALLVTVIAFSAELGRAFVQASAYGEEDRHLLRPPLAYAVASLLTWMVWAVALLAGALLLADRRWVTGAACAVLAVAGAIWGWPRWHTLSRRWFVIVPIGLVVHDHLVLAETLMLRRSQLARIQLARAGTEAADLTGPAPGHAVELQLHEAETAILAATPKQPRGTVIHLLACLVSPSRPGQALLAARQRRLPVD